MRCVIAIIDVLRKRLGFLRAVIITVGAVLRSGEVIKDTRWANSDAAEAKYVKSISLLSAFFLQLKYNFPVPIAMEVMNEIVIKVSFMVDLSFAKKYKLMSVKDPFERWCTFRKALTLTDFGPFNKMEDLEINEEKMHFIVTRCIFHDCFSEVGTPEITKLICNYDKIFYDHLFRELEFNRNGSWENTIGHGMECCHYMWKRKGSN